MKTLDEMNDEVQRRFQGYKELRGRLGLPSLIDEESVRRRMLTEEAERNARQDRVEEEKRSCELSRKQQFDEWHYKLLASHDGTTVFRRKDEVFGQSSGGEEVHLRPPSVTFEVNHVWDLNRASEPLVLDTSGTPWTCRPESAVFSEDGSSVTITWQVEGYGRESGGDVILGWQSELCHMTVLHMTWFCTTELGRLQWRLADANK